MAPRFVKAYVKTNEHDRNDAEAICKGVAHPRMRFVPNENFARELLRLLL